MASHKFLKEQAYIGGKWVSAKSSFDVLNPANGKKLGSVPDLGAPETLKAISAAEKALPEWRAMSAKARSKILKAWFDLIVSNVDDLAALLTAEQGKPLAESKGEILYGASFVEFYAEEAKRAYGDIIPSPIDGARIFVQKQAIGVCAMITPWNFPSAMITRKVAPALAVGCTVVLKPAEATPLSALALAGLGEEAGIPKGVFNVVTTSDAKMVGKVLCEDARVRKLSFTGSTAVGRKLMEQCADSVKKLSLELGGNAPFIVFDDADIDQAVEGAIACKYRNAGQTCVCANRIYVQDGVYDEFAKKLVKAVKKLTVGEGSKKGVSIGPLINQDAVLKVREHIKDASGKGAKILLGGKEHKLGGTFFEPTVMSGVSKDMLVAREETFGPLAPLFRFKKEEDVIAQANDTEFGLASYFYAKDMARIWRVAEALESGMVGVNSPILSTEVAPFGGIKQSGVGREGSRYGLDEFMEMKYILMAE